MNNISLTLILRTVAIIIKRGIRLLFLRLRGAPTKVWKCLLLFLNLRLDSLRILNHSPDRDGAVFRREFDSIRHEVKKDLQIPMRVSIQPFEVPSFFLIVRMSHKDLFETKLGV